MLVWDAHYAHEDGNEGSGNRSDWGMPHHPQAIMGRMHERNDLSIRSDFQRSVTAFYFPAANGEEHRDDKSQGQPGADHAAAFFYAWAESSGDRHVYASRTRFIPATLLQFFEMTTWPLVSAAAAERSARQIRIDVGARMRTMWK